MIYTVQHLLNQFGQQLGLKLITGQEGLNRSIKLPEAHRPGLSLSGYLNHYEKRRILVFGQVEIAYLKGLSSSVRRERLQAILTPQTPAVVVTGRNKITEELMDLCTKEKLPLFHSATQTIPMLNQLISLLTEAFAPTITCHATFVEAFGVGVLIQGDSSVGKSEAALGLIERGHRLISAGVS